MNLELSQEHIASVEEGHPGQVVCVVCENRVSELFAVAKCTHIFCKECSVSYIAAQSNNFSQACCLQDGCRAPLNKSLPIYKLLDQPTLHKLQQFQTFKFLQTNPSFTSCKANDCPGIFPLKTGRCSTCNKPHCKKCLSARHQGKCTLSQEDRQMKKLGYQRCPCCRTWVEKKEGCRYITCKCQTQFCYRCGAEYEKDPCRKRELWEKEVVIRGLISSLPVICSSSVRDVVLLIPRVLVLCLAVAPLALLLFIVPALFMTVAVDVALFFYVIPGLLCQAASEMPTPCKRYCIGVLLIVIYPLVGLLACLFFSLSVVSYPLLGICLSNGLYDYLTGVVSSFAICYLRIVTRIIQCLMCTCPAVNVDLP